MELLIIRHADAGDAEDWARMGKPDSERPLSDKGRKQMERDAKRLVELVPSIDLLVSSPYVRAVETADLVFERFGGTYPRATTDSLVPEAEPEDFVKWLRAQGSREQVAAVGHEPNLSTLATWLIAGLDESRLTLKKGGACLISFEKRIGKREGTLEWLVGPKQLKTG